MKNLSPFNTGKQILSYFEFEQWKKSKSLFSLPEFVEKIFSGMGGISILLGGAVLAGTILGGAMNGYSEVSFLWSLYAFVPAIFLMVIGGSTELLRSIISLKYENKMMQKMNDNLLKKFVHTLLNDSYSPDSMKDFSHYDSLVLANHNDKAKMVEIAYQCMEEFDSSYNEKIIEEEQTRLKKEKQAIIEKFRSDTMAHESSEEKFQFMG